MRYYQGPNNSLLLFGVEVLRAVLPYAPHSRPNSPFVFFSSGMSFYTPSCFVLSTYKLPEPKQPLSSFRQD